MVVEEEIQRLADFYLEGRTILDELLNASSVEDAMNAVEREIAWRDRMLPVVEQVFGALVRARLYILNELEPKETARVFGASAFNIDHALSLVCHDVRLYRYGKRIDSLGSTLRPEARLPARRGRKPGSGTKPDDPLIEEALRLVHEGIELSDWAAAGKVAKSDPGHSEEATRKRVHRKIRALRTK
jgi:hypothetical protein